jgi:peptide/nickel transport system ATP-binding protein
LITASPQADRPPPRPAPAGAPVLDIRNLRTQFPGEDGPITVVNDVSISVRAGETLAVVGESGSGKTMTFLSSLGLVARPGRVMGGQVLLEGVDLLKLSPNEIRRLRGQRISMVFQDPLSGLNPVFTIGDQIIEVLLAHRRMSRREAREQAIRLLARVHIPDPQRRIDDYPHQFSGGMRQRALIAMAIALGPKVLIADEPTTALDVTVQAQILELLTELRDETGMALVLITHDLGLVARYAHRVCVMYGGRIAELGALDDVFTAPRHPYTISLFRSIPHLDTPSDAELTPIEGQPPNPAALPPGCAFEPRCFNARGRADCQTIVPPLLATSNAAHLSACHHWRELEGVSRRS